jgi:hypothetical protein
LAVRPEPDEATSHSTKLAEYASQVAGYVEAQVFMLRQAQHERMNFS